MSVIACHPRDDQGKRARKRNILSKEFKKTPFSISKRYPLRQENNITGKMQQRSYWNAVVVVVVVVALAASFNVVLGARVISITPASGSAALWNAIATAQPGDEVR